MPAWIIPAITGAASIAAAAIGKNRTKTLVDREEKLTQIQSDANKGLAMFNQGLQMDMWKKTGPVGQMEQLKQAGLNPGLIYGMGGAGGQTAAAAQAAPVGRSGADSRTRLDDMMPGIQQTLSSIALINAQKENIQADTAQKQAETAKTTGVDTQKAQTEIQSIIQGISNQKAQEELTKTQNRIASIEETIKTQTQEEAISTIRIAMQQADQEWQKAVRENAIGQETYETAIKQIRANLAITYAQKAMIDQHIKESKQNITESEARTELITEQKFDIPRQKIQAYQDLELKGRHTTTEEDKQRHEEFVNDLQRSTGLPTETAEKILNLLLLKGILGGEGRNVIQGFKR